MSETRVVEDWELDPERLALLFKERDWIWMLPGAVYAVPTADDIRTKVKELVTTVLDEEAFYTQSARLAVFQDPEMPNSFQVALVLGEVRTEPTDLDAIGDLV